jgi:2-polyprenyl-3-methyl-5-hydroxy-6-metoxy-1,4-benzoquinol methylase
MKNSMSIVNSFPKIGERVEIASRFVPTCENLLDIGCGDGALKHFIYHRVKNIFGIDNSELSLIKSKEIYKKVTLLDLNTQDIPYNDNFFDCVTCLDVIEHILDPVLLLNRIYRILKPNGVLIISTPNIRFTDHIYKLIFNGIFPKTSIDTNLYDGGHIHFFTYKDLIDMLIKSKYRMISEEGIINKNKRGWKGRILEFMFKKKLMNEFRSQGILLVVQK